MENFDWTQFTQKIPVKASMEQLYKAWTIPKEIERWFLSDAGFSSEEGNTINKNEAIKSGYSYTWQWFLWDGTEEGIIKNVNGRDHIQFTFAGDCIVDVNLEPYHDGIIVSLKQSNISLDEKSKRDVRLGCHNGWAFYMVNLKSVYEGGLDLRNKDTKLKAMLNS
tara:strand:- start:41 stop:535 length:495 start_codon:yes stop_codon:yes gene_type:complete